jgi:prepilin-type N-terminal cleavage/methylation domain-containing protein
VVKRKGFTLIELIFAIVIVAIIVLSIPMMNLINAKATEGSISQEAVFASSAKLMQTLSFPWDENSSDIEQILEGATVLSGVVKIPNGTSSLDFNDTVCRPGLIARRCRVDQNGWEVNVSNLGDDYLALDPHNKIIRGLDDSGGESNISGTSSEGYKNQYRMVTNVTYVSDNTNSAGGSIDYNASNPFGASFVFSDVNVTGPTSLRLITISTYRSDDTTNTPVTVLRAYGANIGEIKPYRRTY